MTKYSVHHMLHISGIIHHLTVIYVCKVIISSGVFFHFFWEFWFSGSIGGQKGKRWSRMTKKYVCRTPYLRNLTSYDCHLWCKYVKWSYLQVLLSMLKFWFSKLSRGWKGKKWPKMLKISLSYVMFQEPYIIWSSFMVHMYV